METARSHPARRAAGDKAHASRRNAPIRTAPRGRRSRARTINAASAPTLADASRVRRRPHPEAGHPGVDGPSKAARVEAWWEGRDGRHASTGPRRDVAPIVEQPLLGGADEERQDDVMTTAKGSGSCDRRPQPGVGHHRRRGSARRTQGSLSPTWQRRPLRGRCDARSARPIGRSRSEEPACAPFLNEPTCTAERGRSPASASASSACRSALALLPSRPASWIGAGPPPAAPALRAAAT